MKFDIIKTLKILEFTYFYSLMLMVRLKDILHIDTPERATILNNVLRGALRLTQNNTKRLFR